MGKIAEQPKVGTREEQKFSKEPWLCPAPSRAQAVFGQSLTAWVNSFNFPIHPAESPATASAIHCFLKPWPRHGVYGTWEGGAALLRSLRPGSHRGKPGDRGTRIDSATKAFGAGQWEKSDL